MNMDLIKTLKAIENKLKSPDTVTVADLRKAYEQTIRLRSQLLGVIYEQEIFGKSEDPELSNSLSEGDVGSGTVTLTIHEPLPSMKEFTSAVQDHWLELIHTAIGKASQKGKLPRFERAFVWIEVTTPRGTNNARLWDTSNRAVNLIINNLKGIFFEDDNLEHMAFGVAGKWGEKGVTVIRVLPSDRMEQAIIQNFSFSP